MITRGPKEKEAADAGADMVGADEFLPKIKEGWTDVDVIIATPDMMVKVVNRCWPSTHTVSAGPRCGACRPQHTLRKRQISA